MTAIAHPAAPVAADRRPSSLRLVAVELRKMTDTRAGFWLPLGIAAITVVTVLITMLTGPAGRHTLSHVLANSTRPAALLLPVMGVLSVTSEWSQRTALTTFTLVPGRARVLAAKLAAAVVASLAALVVCLVVSVLGVALGSGDASGTWSLSAAMIPQVFVYLAQAMIMGVAFGAAVLISAPAIVAYFLLPTAWAALASNISGLRRVATWLDGSTSLDPMAAHPLSATGWSHALATLAVWVALPLLIGAWRLMRRDVG